MEITIKQKDQYGAVVFVPVCIKAQTFAKLAKTKTLTMDAIDCIKALGYTINVQADLVKL